MGPFRGLVPVIIERTGSPAAAKKQFRGRRSVPSYRHIFILHRANNVL